MAGSNMYRGTLELLILRSLKQGPLHGYGIGQWVRRRSGGVLDPEEGILYPALRRLEEKGQVRGRWGKTETGRKARFYTLTKRGKNTLGSEMARWEEHAGAVFAVLAEGDE